MARNSAWQVLPQTTVQLDVVSPRGSDEPIRPTTKHVQRRRAAEPRRGVPDGANRHDNGFLRDHGPGCCGGDRRSRICRGRVRRPVECHAVRLLARVVDAPPPQRGDLLPGRTGQGPPRAVPGTHHAEPAFRREWSQAVKQRCSITLSALGPAGCARASGMPAVAEDRR